MLSLSRKTDYALVALAYLAESGLGAGPLSSRHIAQAVGLPEPVTQAVLKALASAGLVDSTRGASGGYELGRSAGQITVLDVVHVIEGPVATAVCCCDEGLPILDQDCPLAGRCQINPGIHNLHRRLTAVLEQTTLADLLYPAAEDQPQRTSSIAQVH